MKKRTKIWLTLVFFFALLVGAPKRSKRGGERERQTDGGRGVGFCLSSQGEGNDFREGNVLLAFFFVFTCYH